MGLVPRLLLSSVLLVSCAESPEPIVLVDPPEAVQQSFDALLDSLVPKMEQALAGLGYHMGMGSIDDEQDTTSLTPGSPRISTLSEDERGIGLYEASFGISFHDHPQAFNGLYRSHFQEITLVTSGSDNPWGLLVEDGYLYGSLAWEGSSRSDLPLDTQVAIRDLFPPEWRFEAVAWYRFRQEELEKRRTERGDSIVSER